MNKRDSLGNRMKGYENCYRLYLSKRSCVIVRIDMRAGHSFTKGFARPYDEVFARAMWETAKKLCENVSGAKFAYTQSDEISLVLTDYDSINTEPWFGNNLQKIVSVTASMATLYFNNAFSHEMTKAYNNMNVSSEQLRVYQQAYALREAMFDSRAFLLPREEVFNYFWWRQLDTKRNSILLLGQAHYSQKQLQNKKCDEIQETLLREKDIDWNNEVNWFKNGVAFYKTPVKLSNNVIRNKWYMDMDTPIFTQDHNYINKHVEVNDV